MFVCACSRPFDSASSLAAGAPLATSAAPASGVGASAAATADIDLMQFMPPPSSGERAKQLEVKRAQFVQELLFSSLAQK